MTSHTPGPWSWHANPNGGARVQTAEVGIADVLSRAGAAHPAQETCEANARLIAAAPELVAALQDISTLIIDGEAAPSFTYSNLCEAVGTALVALRKAGIR